MDESDFSTSPPVNRLWYNRITSFFLVRIILALVIISVPTGGLNRLLHLLDPYIPASLMEPWRFFRLILTILFMQGMYILYVRVFEKRRVREFGSHRFLGELGLGVAVGFGIIAISHGILALAGVYSIGSFHSFSNLIFFLYISIMSGYVEELYMRGVLFRLVEQGLGSWIALIVSALVFGFSHLSNPNATVLSSTFISVEAGLLLAAAYMYTRRLWLPMAIHFTWNFTLGGLFGTPVSGIAVPGLVEGRLNGPKLLTGGEFGLEASLITAFIATSAGVVFLVLAYRKGFLIPVPWRRPKVNSSNAEDQQLEVPETYQSLDGTEQTNGE
ncbi:MAG: type II CAAX endopeptidase family protein [bacterium]